MTLIGALITWWNPSALGGSTADNPGRATLLASLVSVVMHLGFGAGGLRAAHTFADARRYLWRGGTVYLVAGLLKPYAGAGHSPLALVINSFHLWLGVLVVILGLATAARGHFPD